MALYLRGRALQDQDARPNASSSTLESNWREAKRCYLAALQLRPSRRLEGYLLSSLGTIAYFDNDYPQAIERFTGAMRLLDDAGQRSWCLLRIGLSQQRLERFSDADQTLERVGREYPGSVAAQEAARRRGARSFMVQLATFSNPARASAAIASLVRQGTAPVRSVDSMGRQIVRIGPVPTYDQALRLRAQHAVTYPDALILP